MGVAPKRRAASARYDVSVIDPLLCPQMAAASQRKLSTRGGAPAQERELRAQGKKTMRKLLDAAMVVFEKRGYHAARVDDIVKVAPPPHRTLSLYLPTNQ